LISRGACAWRAGHGLPDSAAFSEPRLISLAPATAALYRKALFARVGLFEEAFESYLEDADFGLRCARLGLRGIYVPTAVALHHGSATLGRWHRRTVHLLARNQVLLAARHLDLLANFWPLLAGQLLWGAVAARHGCLGAWLQGKVEGLRLAGAIAPERAPRPSRYREGAALIQSLLREHEAELRRLASGPYWKIYFLLTPGEWI